MDLVLAPGYQPHEKQKEFHRSGKRFLSAAAGVRGGKTYSGVVEFTRRILRDVQAGKGRKVSGEGGASRRPSLHYWIVSPIASLLKEPWRYLFEIVPRELIKSYNQSTGSLWLQGNVLIESKTADNAPMLVAVGLDGLFVDEAARVKPDAWKGQLRQRLTDRNGWAIFASTPLGRHNWFYEEIVAKEDPHYQTVSWRTIDNPHIDPLEVEQAKRELPLRWFQREYLASFDAFVGLIYDEFDERVHVTSEAQLRMEYQIGTRDLRSLFRRVICGVDWGWNHPSSLIVIGEIGDGQFVVLEESHGPHRMVYDARNEDITLVGIAKAMQKRWGITQFFCDHAPANIHDFKRNGLNALFAEKEVMNGIRRFGEMLHVEHGKSRLRIMNTCTNLLKEIRSYRWDSRRGNDNPLEYPADAQQDDSLDAARYAIVELARFDQANQPKRVLSPFATGRPIG